MEGAETAQRNMPSRSASAFATAWRAEDRLRTWLARRGEMAGEEAGDALFLGLKGRRLPPRSLHTMVKTYATLAGVRKLVAEVQEEESDQGDEQLLLPHPGASSPGRRP